MRPKIVITGLGFITSIGNSRDAVRDSLVNLTSGIRPMPWLLENNSSCPIKVAGTIPDFDVSGKMWAQWRFPARYKIRRDALRSLAPHGVYAICAVYQALAEAQLTEAELSADDTGLFCASAGSPFLMRHYLNQLHETGGTRGNPMGVVSTISGTLNFNLGAYFHIRGGNVGFVSACASSSHAIGYAMDEIRCGRHNRIVVVGAEDLNAESMLPFAAMRALSLHDGPDASRPFDRSRDGFVGTGGAVALIIENEETALQRNAPIVATLEGWGHASDGYNIAISHEQGQGLARAIRNALADAQITPIEVDYVNAHATSTVVGDVSEARAISSVFGDNSVPVSSTKALTGHSLSMSGALETAICALCAQESILPGQANLNEVDPACTTINLPRTSTRQELHRILSNSSGFGGSNVAIVVGRA